MNHQNGKKKLRVLLAIVAVVLIIVVAVGLICWNNLLGLVGDAQETVPTLSQEEIEALLGTTEATEPESTTPEETWPEVRSDKNITNIMLVGQNWREDEQNKLSDTMILCSINREKKTLTMVSFLRDLYVPLPAYAGHGPGRNRINVCYALGSTWKRTSEGGMEMLALCVEQNFGVHVDHTIEVGFDTFAQIVEAFGGVEINVTEPEAEYMTEKVGYVGEIQPGPQTLNGYEALAYARIRKIDSDRQRSARQRMVISSLIQKCKGMNLMELYDIAKAVLPMIITDMTPEEITNYIWEFLPQVKDVQIRTLTIPVDNETLPNSMWGKTIDLYGYQSNVVECNTKLNGTYLRQQLGLEDVAE